MPLENPGDARGRDDAGPPDEAGEVARFLSEGGEAAGFVTNNLGLSPYDAHIFGELVRSDPELRALAARSGRGRVPETFCGLLFDLFLLHFKFVPAFVPETETDPAHLRANRPVLGRLLDTEETMLARLTTATNHTASALAAAEAAKRILEELDRRPELADWMREQAATPAPPQASPKTPPEARTEGAPVPAEPPEPPELQSPMPHRQMGALVAAASEGAAGEAEAHRLELASWGLEPADLAKVPLRERLELARKLRTERMRRLADLLGRMRSQRSATRREKARATQDEIHSVTTSRDISRVLPSELAGAFGAGQPERTQDFFRRLSEGSVPSYSMRTKKPVGAGPVVALVDTSYSMDGEPMAWASAVSLALAQAATRSGSPRGGARPLTALFFNESVVLEVPIALGERDPRKFLQIGTVAAAGGTRYEAPLDRACYLIEEARTAGAHQKAHSRADVLLVTDGLCELRGDSGERFAEKKQALGFGLVLVLVGSGAAPGTLAPLANTTVRASDLARASGARDAAARVFEAL